MAEHVSNCLRLLCCSRRRRTKASASCVTAPLDPTLPSVSTTTALADPTSPSVSTTTSLADPTLSSVSTTTPIPLTVYQPFVPSEGSSALQNAFDYLLYLTLSLEELEALPSVEPRPGHVSVPELFMTHLRPLIECTRKRLQDCEEILVVTNVEGLTLMDGLIVDGFYRAPLVRWATEDGVAVQACIDSLRFSVEVISPSSLSASTALADPSSSMPASAPTDLSDRTFSPPASASLPTALAHLADRTFQNSFDSLLYLTSSLREVASFSDGVLAPRHGYVQELVITHLRRLIANTRKRLEDCDEILAVDNVEGLRLIDGLMEDGVYGMSIVRWGNEDRDAAAEACVDSSFIIDDDLPVISEKTFYLIKRS